MFNLEKFASQLQDGATLKKNGIKRCQEANLVRALQTMKGTQNFSREEQETRWTHTSAMQIFKEIAETGYCKLKSLSNEVRIAGVSLMRHNIVHYRPCQPIIEDIPGMLIGIRNRPTRRARSGSAISSRSLIDEEPCAGAYHHHLEEIGITH